MTEGDVFAQMEGLTIEIVAMEAFKLRVLEKYKRQQKFNSRFISYKILSMENNSTTILNEILEKLSVLTKEDEMAQGIENEDVVSEKVEASSQELSTDLKDEDEAPAPTPEPVEAEEAPDVKTYVTMDAFNEVTTGLKAEIEAIKQKMMAEVDKYKSQKEELSKEVEKLSAEPAAEPIKHSPESDSKKLDLNLGNNRPQTTLDRVMQRISK